MIQNFPKSSSFSAIFHTLVLLTKALNIVDSNENFQRFLSHLNRCILKFPCVYLQRAYFHSCSSNLLGMFTMLKTMIKTLKIREICLKLTSKTTNALLSLQQILKNYIYFCNTFTTDFEY